MWETWVWSLAWEDPLEKGKPTYSSILTLRIPWTTIQGFPKSWTWLSDFYFTSLPRYNFSSALFKPAWELAEGWVHSQTYPPRWLAAIWGVLFLFPCHVVSTEIGRAQRDMQNDTLHLSIMSPLPSSEYTLETTRNPPNPKDRSTHF